MIRLVIGLGNPGRRYRMTRHNIGSLVVEEVARRRGTADESEMAHCLVSRFVEDDLVLARPGLFMNQSGRAVRAVMGRFEVAPEEVLVVSDDLNLDFGVLRVRRAGSHGGHNGLRSIIASLGTQAFPRLRIGIGPAADGEDQADFVLQRFTAGERARLDEVIAGAADCVDTVVREGLERSMNRCNRTPGRTPGDAPAGE